MNYRGRELIRELVTTASYLFGTDAEDKAGVGPFSLPEGHPFHRAGAVHDYFFTQAKLCAEQGLPLNDATLNQANVKLFRMFSLIAQNATTEAEQLELMLDTCAYFPWALKVGEFLWKGPRELV